MSSFEATTAVDSSFQLEDTIRKLSTILCRYVVPLFSEGRAGRPEPRGSGFLVSSGNCSYLISAAHVLDCHSSLFFYVEPKTQQWLSGELRRTRRPDGKSRESDRLDVGVLKLRPPDLPPYPGVGKHAMPIGDLTTNALPRESKRYLVLGYPGSKSQPHLVRHDLTSEPHAFYGTSAPTQRYTDCGLAVDSHLVITFDRGKARGLNGDIRTFPHPAGMSGSPVWLLYDEKGPNDPTRTPVVGIFIEYRKSLHLMIATDIGAALSMINEDAGLPPARSRLT